MKKVKNNTVLIGKSALFCFLLYNKFIMYRSVHARLALLIHSSILQKATAPMSQFEITTSLLPLQNYSMFSATFEIYYKYQSTPHATVISERLPIQSLHTAASGAHMVWLWGVQVLGPGLLKQCSQNLNSDLFAVDY